MAGLYDQYAGWGVGQRSPMNSFDDGGFGRLFPASYTRQKRREGFMPWLGGVDHSRRCCCWAGEVSDLSLYYLLKTKVEYRYESTTFFLRRYRY